MTTQREYLCSLNPPLAKPSRGRFSQAAKDALAAARATGMTFDDDNKPDPKPKRINTAMAAEAEASSDLDNPDSGGAYTAKEPKTTKANEHAPHRRNWTDQQYILFDEPAGMVYCKTPCANCGYSVNNCRCSEPAVFDLSGSVKCKRVD